MKKMIFVTIISVILYGSILFAYAQVTTPSSVRTTPPVANFPSVTSTPPVRTTPPVTTISPVTSIPPGTNTPPVTTTSPVQTVPPLPSAIIEDTGTPASTTIVIAPKSPVDDEIVTAVYAKFAKTPALIGTEITANSVNGIVTLNGTVTAQSQADAAVEAAQSIGGVKGVRSTINVTTNPDLNKPAPLTPKY
jgi:hypothetical protein